MDGDLSVDQPYYEDNTQHEDGIQAQTGLSELQAQRQQYYDWCTQYIASNAAAAADGQPSEDDSDQGLDSDPAQVGALVGTLYSAASAYSYVAALKSWSEAVKELDRLRRDLPAPFLSGPSAAASAAPKNAWAAAASGSSSSGVSVEAYTSAMTAAIEALGSAVYCGEVAAYYSHAALHAAPQLGAVAAAIDARMQECRYALYTRLNKDTSDLLDACHWPPPLVSSSSSAQPQQPEAGGPAGQDPEQLPSADGAEAAAAGGEEGGAQGSASGGPPRFMVPGAPAAADAGKEKQQQEKKQFTGFGQDPERLPQLLAALSCLTRLQQATDRAAFGHLKAQDSGASEPSVQEGPLLWAAAAIAAPLQARLLTHFDPATAAGRLDKPEWLFKLVLQLVQEHAHHMAVLQPAVTAAGLGGHYHMVVEWARGMREAAKAVLRSARLPALVDMWDRGEPGAAELWAAQIGAIIEFETKLAPFLGAGESVRAGDALPDALLEGGALAAVTEDYAAGPAWEAVERAGALARLERAAEDERAWLPLGEDEELDMLGEGGPSSRLANGAGGSGGAAAAGAGGAGARGEPGWQKEFNPPRFAQEVVAVVGDVVERSRFTPSASRQRDFLDAVGGAVLARATEILRGALDQAASFNAITSSKWAPKVASAVTAARYLHHTLCELLEGPSLSRVHTTHSKGQAGGAAGEGGEGGQGAAGPAGAGHPPATPKRRSGGGMGAGQGGPGGFAGLGTKAMAHPSDTPATSAWGTPAKEKGGVLMMGEVVIRPSFAPTHVDPPVLAAAVAGLGALHREWCLAIARELAFCFGKAAVNYRTAVEQAAQYPTHSGAAGTVTPALLPALVSLQAGLAALSGPLDGPSFRDIWRAVTVPVNRFMFNYVATEARFSAAGAQQFAVDCAGLVAVFSPYTGRPGAHFRETLAAARLLTLPDEHASEAVRRASEQLLKMQPLWKEPWLMELGVGCLGAQQVVAVVERRL